MANLFNGLIDIINRFVGLFIWWFTLTPWEKALRVSAKAKVVEYGPGLHFRIPYWHTIYKQSVRLYYEGLGPPLTLTTKDNITLTLNGVVGYCINDLHKLYNSMQHVEYTLKGMVQGAISAYISTHNFIDCSPEAIETKVLVDLNFEKYGLSCSSLKITTYARVKTYRIISGESAVYGISPFMDNASSNGMAAPK